MLISAGSVLVLLGAFALCAGAFLFLLLGFDVGYADPTGTWEWMRKVAQVANAATVVVAILAGGVAVTVLLLWAGVGLRHGTLTWISGISCVMVAATLLLLGFQAPARMSLLVDRAVAAVENTPAVVPAEPEPSPSPLLTAEAARNGLRAMIAVSLAAAVGEAHDEDGSSIDAAEVVLTSAACGERGTQLEATLEFSTDDNAASLERILAAWDAEGYAPDRALHVDIRWSESLPVAVMTIRDATTIDGRIHLQVRSRCATLN